MKESKKHTKGVAAARSGMDPKTARKYLKAGALPSELKQPRAAFKRPGVFDDHWDEIEDYLSNSPGLEAKTLLYWLINENPDRYNHSQLRTFQRRVKTWRALEGPDKEVFFGQVHKPGHQCQADYTCMNALGITICGHAFKHLLFHLMFPYSGWEAANVCFSESFESLCDGFEQSIWLFGGVPKQIRTDNLSAATKKMGSTRAFNDCWLKVTEHYNMQASRNNPGKSNENGAVEKSHDLLKNDIDQQLMMRGSRDFNSEESYSTFVQSIIDGRNKIRQEKMLIEKEACADLPSCRWYHPKTTTAKVSKESLIFVDTVAYSVPSRLINQQVTVKLYPDKLDVYFGRHFIETIARKDPGETGVNYRHIIHQLVRKPGAFEHYKYKESLFPRIEYRKAYDALRRRHEDANKKYLQVLEFAAQTNEHEVAVAIEVLLDSALSPTIDEVKTLVDIPLQEPPSVQINQPQLRDYDQLINLRGTEHVIH